jgi:hypothetical protein
MALEHIVMHVALCKAVARLAPRTTVAMRVVVTDKSGRSEVDRSVQFQRGTAGNTPFEFDSSWGVYRIDVAVPKYRCGGVEFMYVLADHDRSINVALSDSFVKVQVPVVLVFGSLPMSFAYVQPTVVTFSPQVPCNGKVSDPAPSGIDNQIEQDAYYATVRTPALYRQPKAVTVALQLKDASGGYHYLRIPLQVEPGRYAWPNRFLIPIDDAAADFVAQEPEETLLCPKGYSTSIE